jgi:hypothetical protein
MLCSSSAVASCAVPWTFSCLCSIFLCVHVWAAAPQCVLCWQHNCCRALPAAASACCADQQKCLAGGDMRRFLRCAAHFTCTTLTAPSCCVSCNALPVLPGVCAAAPCADLEGIACSTCRLRLHPRSPADSCGHGSTVPRHIAPAESKCRTVQHDMRGRRGRRCPRGRVCATQAATGQHGRRASSR